MNDINLLNRVVYGIVPVSLLANFSEMNNHDLSLFCCVKLDRLVIMVVSGNLLNRC